MSEYQDQLYSDEASETMPTWTVDKACKTPYHENGVIQLKFNHGNSSRSRPDASSTPSCKFLFQQDQMAKLTEIPSATTTPTDSKKLSGKKEKEFAAIAKVVDDTPVDEDGGDISDDEDLIASESLMDRIKALQDIFPQHSRENLLDKTSVGVSMAFKGAKLLGNVAWVLTTTALVTVIPVMFAMDQEQQYAQFEQEQLAAHQANQALLSGPQSQQLQQGLPSMPVQQHLPARQ